MQLSWQLLYTYTTARPCRRFYWFSVRSHVHDVEKLWILRMRHRSLCRLVFQVDTAMVPTCNTELTEMMSGWQWLEDAQASDIHQYML